MANPNDVTRRLEIRHSIEDNRTSYSTQLELTTLRYTHDPQLPPATLIYQHDTGILQLKAYTEEALRTWVSYFLHEKSELTPYTSSRERVMDTWPAMPPEETS